MIPMTGEAVIWDGTNIQEIREVAGESFRGVEVDLVLVHDELNGGSINYLKPGWTLLRVNGRVLVFSPYARKALLENI